MPTQDDTAQTQQGQSAAAGSGNGIHLQTIAVQVGSHILQKPVVPDGQDIYDSIMGQIEPELLSHHLPTLDQPRIGETDEEQKARMKRYQTAMSEYDKQYASFMEKLAAEVEAYRKTAISSLEDDDRTKEEGALQDLESTILSL